MRKIFIEDSRVVSFLNDLRIRLIESLKKNQHVTELHIIGLGESGTQVAQVFWNNCKFDEHKDASLWHVASAQKNDSGDILFITKDGKPICANEYIESTNKNAAFLVLDGICRTGRTLTEVYEQLRKGSKTVWTYSIAVCADSSIIPTWYGCLYLGNEFVVLSREGKTPNTGLYIGKGTNSDSPALTLRPPLDTDPDFDAGSAPSISRYKSEDRYFDSTTHSKKIQVLEWNSEPVGFIAYHISGSTLWIDYIVACQKHANSKKGIGTALYYHVENYAKLCGCSTIALWAIQDKVDWYKKRGFSIEAGKNPISIGKGEEAETYQSMSHRLLSEMGHYHQ